MFRLFHSRQILSPSKTGFIGSVHRLINITLLTLVKASSKGGRRPMSLMRTHTQYSARSEYHTQLANMSFDDILFHDLTAGENFISLYYISIACVPGCVCHNELSHLLLIPAKGVSTLLLGEKKIGAPFPPINSKWCARTSRMSRPTTWDLRKRTNTNIHIL